LVPEGIPNSISKVLAFPSIVPFPLINNLSSIINLYALSAELNDLVAESLVNSFELYGVSSEDNKVHTTVTSFVQFCIAFNAKGLSFLKVIPSVFVSGSSFADIKVGFLLNNADRSQFLISGRVKGNQPFSLEVFMLACDVLVPFNSVSSI